jgi:hypothetical protein
MKFLIFTPTRLVVSQVALLLISSKAEQPVKRGGAEREGGDNRKGIIKQESIANPAVDSLFAMQSPPTELGCIQALSEGL